MRALGSRTIFNALSQEKTGDFWLNGHMYGSQMCHTAEDIHHCDLLLVIGANPRLAHGFTNARDQLNGLRKDGQRKLIVIDPRRTETAEAADLHIGLRPGTDAFLMGALLAELQRRNAFDEAFLAAHTIGADEVKAALARVPVAEWLAAADVAPADFERLVQMVIDAKAMVVRVELGIQQGLNSTLNSYLEKLLYLMTGHFGRAGTHWLHSWLVPLWGNTPGARHFATQAEVICGLLSPNVFPDAVLSDHPDRLRALWVDSSNPVNTAADTARVLQAMRALDLMVVVDVAFTETAAQAHYVLPASSTYEKCEFTLFNFEAPTNYFHVRAPVLPPLPGTLPEPEIYGRLARALDLMPADEVLADLAAKAGDPAAFGAAFNAAVAAGPQRRQAGRAGAVRDAGPQPARRHGGSRAAVAWPATAWRRCRRRRCAGRCGIDDAVPLPELGERLFRQVVGARSGTAFTVHDSPWELVEHPDRKLRLAVPEMLDWLGRLDPASVGAPADWPFVLVGRAAAPEQCQPDPARPGDACQRPRRCAVHPPAGPRSAGRAGRRRDRRRDGPRAHRRAREGDAVDAARPCRAAPWLRAGASRRRRTPQRGRPGDQLADRWAAPRPGGRHAAPQARAGAPARRAGRRPHEQRRNLHPCMTWRTR